MLMVEGYSINEQIYQGRRYAIYRGLRLNDQKPVILKTFQYEHPSLDELAALQHEYQILKQIELSGIIRVYTLIKQQHQTVMVLEDINGQPLSQYLVYQPLSLSDFFTIALQLTDVLSALHQQHIIHKKINPHNILIQPNSFAIKLIDFSIASQLSEETTTYIPINQLEDSLSYLSPEQTGRMNRAINYRTDLYSLGVTFYEMLTGELPFQGKDSLELIHGHLAQTPKFISKINSNVPEQLASVIAKLLEKHPEDRYASAQGLKADLMKCQQQWQTKKHIERFPLGQQDIHDQLIISHKLYGREAQIQQLLEAFYRVAQGHVELFLVTGYSGIGKSSLVKEIHIPVIRQQGYFINGKYDQLQRTTPYSALIEAFQKLTHQLLGESEERLANLREDLLKALGNNGQVIIDVIPAMELIIGRQPPIPQLPLNETQNRFMLTFQNFVRALADPKHPLVIFLDDLQWIDAASLQLLTTLLSDRELQHLLIIGAYRDNEVTLEHPLTITLQQLEKINVKMHQVVLTPLALGHIQQLLEYSLNSHADKIKSLAQLLLDKTEGNPFFISEFLKQLYHDKLLYFSYESNQWQWDIARIQEQAVTDNVVDLLTLRIRQLPEAAQKLLKLAACIGHTFDLKTLSIISEQSINELLPLLWDNIQINLITPLEEGYKTSALLGEEPLFNVQDLKILRYQFTHDRIQQAAYQLIPEDKRRLIHLKIGRLLLKEQPLQENDEHLFKVLDHFNQSVALIKKSTEKHQVAQYNLWAGQKAKASTAYAAAKDYLQKGLYLLKPFNWDIQHDLIFNLSKELATCEYLTGNFEKVQPIFNELFKHTTDVMQKLELYKLHCEMLSTRNQHQQAVEEGLTALTMVGIHLPKNPSTWRILTAILRIKWLTGWRKAEDIKLLPMTHVEYQAGMSLMLKLFNSMFMTNPKLFVLFVCKITELSLRYGYAEATSVVCLAYAHIIIHKFHWYSEGMLFADLDVQLKKQYGINLYEGQNQFGLGTFIVPWRAPLQESLDVLNNAYQLCYEAGDLVFANYSNNLMIITAFMAGLPLSEVGKLVQKTFYFSRKAKIKDFQKATYILHYFIGVLMGNISFEIEKLRDLENEVLHQKHNAEISFFYCLSIKICYLFSYYGQALQAVNKYKKYMDFNLGMVVSLESVFYHALALLADYSEGKKHSLKLLRSLCRSIRRWSDWCSINYQHYSLLLDAEIARIQNKPWQAISLYEQAIKQAHKQNALSIVGIGYECAARFYIQHVNYTVAKVYMQNAHYAYQKWGAIAKCQLLEKHYPEWFQNKSLISSSTGATSAEISSMNIDMLSILKFTQTLSGEIELDKLLQKLLSIVLQEGGAQRGLLLAKRLRGWVVEAEGTAEEQKIYLIEASGIEERTDLPLTLIYYVQKTQKLLVKNTDSDLDNNFANDSYITQFKPQSLLLQPIFYQGQLKYLLYLENRITANAFTLQQLQSLELLATQAAISLENAHLFYQATHDSLTGLANRNFLHQTFQDSLHRATRTHTSIAVLFLDLDHFKAVNDTLGHEIGDKLLLHVSAQIKSCLRKQDIAARLGGDEFVIVLNEVSALDEIKRIADRLFHLLDKPLLLSSQKIKITASVGISCFPQDGNDIETLLKHADVAMYRAKDRGKNNYQFF